MINFNPDTSYVITGGEFEGTNRYISSESLYHLIEYSESDSKSNEQLSQITSPIDAFDGTVNLVMRRQSTKRKKKKS